MAFAPLPSFTSALDSNPSYFSSSQVLVAQITGVTDSLSRIQQACFFRCCCRIDEKGEKTIRAHSEAQLQTWEKSCSDRCVSKHIQTHELVGEELAKILSLNQQPQQKGEEGEAYKPISFAYM